MKTKNLLYAMALPVLFGACAQDEFENVVKPSDNLLATEGVNIGQVAISVGEKAETRLGQSGSGAWNVWNTNDIIGAVQYTFYRRNDSNPVKATPEGSMVAQHPMTLEDGSLFRGHTMAAFSVVIPISSRVIISCIIRCRPSGLAMKTFRRTTANFCRCILLQLRKTM